MKIGIVTFNYHPNIGACMQAYALKKVLENMGHEVHHIFERAWGGSDRHKLFIDFCEKNFDFRTCDEKFDLVLCGSDQIWSIGISKLIPFYFADFAKDQTIVASYAASLGDSNLNYPGQKLIFEMNLRRFDYISIREPFWKKALEEITHKPVEIHLDPTLLLEPGLYRDFIKETPFARQYILSFIHYYPGKDDNLRALSEDLSAKTQVGVVHNMVDVSFNDLVGDISMEGPEDIMTTIYYAEYIITQSFHTVVFAILFKKRFYYMSYDDSYNGREERIKHLLRNLDLSDRIIKADKPLPDDFDREIDWISVNRKLYELKKSSLDYLYAITSGKRQPRTKDYFVSRDKFTCYGCAACVSACPVGAISFDQDNEGFYFPSVNRDTCVNCAICHGVCPYNNKKKESGYSPECYLTFNKNEEDHIKSSSGGIFPALADEVLQNGGFVVGVKLDENFVAVYDIAENQDDCYKFRYSKYVEAADNSIFEKTKAALETGRPLLFTGTPCKIAGLKNYLGKSYDNLILLDFICHGTPSPLALRKWLEAMEEKHKSKLTYFQFRTPKLPSWQMGNEYIFENGDEEVIPRDRDLFIRAFSKDIFLKKSCYVCEFTRNNGLSDITIGDFWGSNKYYSGDTANGVSALKVNTSKGKVLLEKVKDKLYLQPQKFWDIYSNNMNKPTRLPNVRGAIFNWLESKSASDAFEMALTQII